MPMRFVVVGTAEVVLMQCTVTDAPLWYGMQVRERKNKWDDFTHENHDDHEGLGEADLKEHEELTKVCDDCCVRHMAFHSDYACSCRGTSHLT